MRRGRLVRRGLAVTALASALIAVAGTSAPAQLNLGATGSGPPLPTQDPFYSYDSARLASIAPGSVLRSRTVTVDWAGLSTPVTAIQLLYRTTTELGAPAATVTTVLQAARTSGLPVRILSYQMFYDGLGPSCDPSYNLRETIDPTQLESGAVPETGNDSQVEEGFMTPYLAAGDTLVISDYEGEDLAWAAGQQSGYQTLDGIRAAENFLHVSSRGTPVAMLGYSGGSIPSVWAEEMAPAYAPELDVVGSAAGGVPPDLADAVPYLNGSPSWAGVMPGVLVGVSRGFHIDLMSYLSPYGQKLAQTVGDECAGSFQSAYPGLTIQQLVKPQYQDFLGVPPVASVVNELIMGSDGTPRAPVFLAVGNADGTGDGVMVAADVEGLAHRYCQRGVPVQYDEYPQMDHLKAGAAFEARAYSLIQAWLAGLPTPSGCATIGSGSSLAPLAAGTAPPEPPAAATDSANVTSIDPTGISSTFDGPDTLTVDGAGAATLARFAPGHDPVGPARFKSTGRFIDIAVAPGSQLTGATLSICGVAKARILEWWDPADGAWKPVSPAAQAGADPVRGEPPRCLTATFTGSSSPTVGQLGSVVFGLSK